MNSNTRPEWHILLIEDSAEDRADLRQMLLRGGNRRYRFSEAGLGAVGVRMALDPTNGPIDCVLLDYGLPDMDAPEVLAALCADAGLPPWPVVVITGSSVEERSGLLSAGAQDYIGKRWTSPESLTRAIENAVERFALQAALIAAKAEAETANRAKSDFLLAMSHELRSPLSTMLGFTQLIESGKPAPTPAQQDSVQQVLKAGWYLLGLINEILDLGAIESGQLMMSVQAMSINDVLQDCQAMLQPQAQDKNIQLTFPQMDPPCWVQADPIRTKQVLINLLSNAIKFNRRAGQVEVRCTVLPNQRVRVSVVDTGLGLSAAQVAQLFQPFNRLGQSAGGESGTGIGLVICKRLVELMGGHIGAQSTVCVGSCFWFELNAALALHPATPQSPQGGIFRSPHATHAQP
jgi:signal transduction histidine kinase